MELTKTVKIILLVVILLAGAWYTGLIPVQPAQALGQRTAVIYIRAIAADLELTSSQVENLTKQQAYNYLIAVYPSVPADKIKELSAYWSGDQANVLAGIKLMLWNDAVERRTQDRLVLFKQRIESAYPDAVGLQTEYARDIAMQLLPLLYGEVDPNALD